MTTHAGLAQQPQTPPKPAPVSSHTTTQGTPKAAAASAVPQDQTAIIRRYCVSLPQRQQKIGRLVARDVRRRARRAERRSGGEDDPQAAGGDDAAAAFAAPRCRGARGARPRARDDRRRGGGGETRTPACARSSVSIAPNTRARFATCWRSTWTPALAAARYRRAPTSTTSRTPRRCRRRCSRRISTPRPRSAAWRSAIATRRRSIKPTRTPATCRSTRGTTSTARRTARAAAWSSTMSSRPTPSTSSRSRRTRATTRGSKTSTSRSTASGSRCSSTRPGPPAARTAAAARSDPHRTDSRRAPASSAWPRRSCAGSTDRTRT